MRALLFVLALSMLVGIPLAAPGGSANHWCNETFVDLSPSFATAGVTETFGISLENTGANITDLVDVQVLFDWESSPRNLGGGTLDPGQTLDLTVTPTAVTSGLHQVTITLRGQNEADTPGIVTCTYNETVATLGGGDIAGAIINLIILVAAIVVIIVIVIVVVIVVVARNKKPPMAQTMPGPYQQPPPYPPQAYYPPQPPPQQPPQGPPPSGP